MEQIVGVGEAEYGDLFAHKESVVLQEHAAFKTPDACGQAGIGPISPLTPLPRQSVIAGMESGSEDQPRLTGAERSKLRSLAQTLDPKVFVGKAGVNTGIANLLAEAFRNADLVKVRFTAEREEMDKQAQELAKITESEVIGTVGRTATFFKLGSDAE
jgi:RNA-binding protein